MSASVAEGRTGPPDQDDVVEVRPTATWLAAYAMGLVASDRQADGVIELADHVGSDPRPLRDARDHLADGVVGDEVLRAGARRLLDAALARAIDAERSRSARPDV